MGNKFTLGIRVSLICNVGFNPLVAVILDIWHCDVQEVYSDDKDQII
jgi:protocatechuate 3,4-dioxygenase beta subunit